MALFTVPNEVISIQYNDADGSGIRSLNFTDNFDTEESIYARLGSVCFDLQHVVRAIEVMTPTGHIQSHHLDVKDLQGITYYLKATKGPNNRGLCLSVASDAGSDFCFQLIAKDSHYQLAPCHSCFESDTSSSDETAAVLYAQYMKKELKRFLKSGQTEIHRSDQTALPPAKVVKGGDDNEMSLESFDILESNVWRGKSAAGHKARCKLTGEIVILKQSLGDYHREEKAKRLVEFTRNCDCPSVCRTLGYFPCDKDLYMVLETGDNWHRMDLVAASRPGGVLPNDELKVLVVEMLETLAFLEKHGVLHGDIKPNNIMLIGDSLLAKHRPIIKLVDFGCKQESRCLTVNNTKMFHCYIPPEVLITLVSSQGEVEVPTYTSNCSEDVWGLGAALFTLSQGEPIIDLAEQKLKNVKTLESYEALVQERLTAIQERSTWMMLDKDVQDAVLECLVVDPSKRSSASVLLASFRHMLV